MPKAIIMEETGGPEVLHLRTVDPGVPGPGEVRMRQTGRGSKSPISR